MYLSFEFYFISNWHWKCQSSEKSKILSLSAAYDRFKLDYIIKETVWKIIFLIKSMKLT